MSLLNYFIRFFIKWSDFIRGEARDEIYRGSYMSAHVLLNLLNELIKKEMKYEAFQALYLFFATSLINSIMLDSIYQMILKLLKNRIFGVKTSRRFLFYATL